MRRHVAGYCFPWDVDEGFAVRAAQLGVDEVAIATAYHSTRAATPWSPLRSAVHARHSALYRPVRESAWGRLRPAAADWVDSADSAGDAVRALRSAGVAAAAWIVLAHNTAVGANAEDVVVRNCFGEPYRWALCPAHDDVREYAAVLASEAVAGMDVRSAVLQACGQMGVAHPHEHDATGGAWSPAVARLLSVCCCAACGREWSRAGADPAEIRGRLRSEVRRLIGGGDATAVSDQLPTDLHELLLSARQRSTDALRRAVLGALGGHRRVVLHADPDPWATGSAPGLTPTAPHEVDAVVVSCLSPARSAVRAVSATADQLPPGVGLGVHVAVTGAPPVPDIGGYVRELRWAGADELHVQHLGPAGPGRLPDVRAAVAAWRE